MRPEDILGADTIALPGHVSTSDTMELAKRKGGGKKPKGYTPGSSNGDHGHGKKNGDSIRIQAQSKGTPTRARKK